MRVHRIAVGFKGKAAANKWQEKYGTRSFPGMESELISREKNIGEGSASMYRRGEPLESKAHYDIIYARKMGIDLDDVPDILEFMEYAR